jgi:hypothetical protein
MTALSHSAGEIHQNDIQRRQYNDTKMTFYSVKVIILLNAILSMLFG